MTKSPNFRIWLSCFRALEEVGLLAHWHILCVAANFTPLSRLVVTESIHLYPYSDADRNTTRALYINLKN